MIQAMTTGGNRVTLEEKGIALLASERNQLRPAATELFKVQGSFQGELG